MVIVVSGGKIDENAEGIGVAFFFAIRVNRSQIFIHIRMYKMVQTYEYR